MCVPCLGREQRARKTRRGQRKNREEEGECEEGRKVCKTAWHTVGAQYMFIPLPEEEARVRKEENG